MSVKLIVGLDIMVESFTVKTNITTLCACLLPDRLFLSALSRATLSKLCLSKWLGRETATGNHWRTVNFARLDHWGLIDF